MPVTNLGARGLGNVLVINFTFAVNGTPTDPTTISFKYQAPASNHVTPPPVTLAYPDPALTRTGTGLYSAQLRATVPGTWYGDAIGTGTCETRQSFSWYVDPDQLYP